MLHLICGPSGAGKTSLLTDMIRRDIEKQTRCFLLVPEQQAYISELDLPTKLPQNAGLYFEIVNFSKLAEDVFCEYGGVTGESISMGARMLLMWDTLRSLSSMLSQYGKSARSDMTLTTMMLRTVNELKMAGVDAVTLENAAKDIDDNEMLQKKLSDIAMIQEMFLHKIESVFGSDPSDDLLRMAAKLRQHRYFEGCNLYIDSFTSFTAQEYGVLSEIMKQANSVTVSLCSDAFYSKLPHFESINETVHRLVKSAEKNNIEITKQLLPPSQTKKPKILQILERDLFRFEITEDNRTLPPMGESGLVQLTVCNNLYEESEAAALRILELVQNGMHYGDIAIVMRDSETYRGVIDAALERYRIPYFLSESTDLAGKPLSRLILSALRAVDKHYQLQDVISLIKTGLAGVDLRDGALFEEYCETWHISGSRFTEALWSMNPDGLTAANARSPRAEEILDSANRVREQIIAPLEILHASMKQSRTLFDRCRAVYDYLQRLDIAGQLAARAKKELQSGQRREAGETMRLYTFITDTLSEIGTLLPDAEMTTEEFTSILSLIFSSTEFGSVPNVHDCVTIGSANTMRVEKIRAALILGLCEGEFPQALADDGIFSEGDKLALEGVGILLDSREQIRTSEELLYVYRALTKPRERLFLSTVTAQPDGSARTPSLAFLRVQTILNRTPDHFDLSAFRTCTKEKSIIEHTEPQMLAPIYQSGATLRLSQSKIQAFLLCPYRYFSTYTLKVRGQKDSTPSYADDGTFLHYVFEHFLRSSLQSDGTLALPPADQIEAIADEILNDYLAEVCPFPPELINNRLLHLFTRLRKLATGMLLDITEELKVSKFVPARFEQEIGSPEGLPPFVIPLKNGSKIYLTGKVDRIDFLEQNGKTVFRIIDYKSGIHKFSMKDVASGMEIQLILYLFAVLASDPEQFRAAGAEYLYSTPVKGHLTVQRSGFFTDDAEIREAADQSDEKLYCQSLQKCTDEEIGALEAEMKAAVTAIAERILAGEAQKTPSEDACKFCPVHANCDKAYHK